MKLKRVAVLYALCAFSLALCFEPQKQNQQTSQETESKMQTEDSLFKMASKAETSNRFEDAIKYYNTIISEYPKSSKRDKALFMAGYIEYEYLKQGEEAKANFTKILEEYPNSDLIDDAQFMLKAINSGKDALTVFEENASGN